jgi:hypothetical protein
MLDRRRFEALVFTYLAEHLRTGDVAITGFDAEEPDPAAA